MIYVTVGNHYQGFDRLLKEIDRIAESSPHEFIVQRGHSKTDPVNCESSDFYPYEVAESYIENADLVIGHAGAGIIMSSRRQNTPLIICPRLKKYSEHINDHQLELSRVISEENIQGVFPCLDISMLGERLQDILLMNLKGKLSNSNRGARNIAREINSFMKIRLRESGR